MPEWDALIVGGGPAGLTAGLYLSRGGWKTLLLEKENVGGYIVNVEMIENYPGFSQGVAGAQLAVEMKNQAAKVWPALPARPGNQATSLAWFPTGGVR